MVAKADLKELKTAVEPFLRAYRVCLEPFPASIDERGLRDALPGVWPTTRNLHRLFEAAIKAGLDYK